MKLKNENLSEVTWECVPSLSEQQCEFWAQGILERVPPALPADPVVQKSSLRRRTSLHFVFAEPDTAVPQSQQSSF